MRPENDRLFTLCCAALMALSAGMFAYRTYLDLGADPITKALCDGRPVFSGSYSECLNYYAPATREISAANGSNEG